MSILAQVANVAFAHGGNQIFDNASFVLQERDRVALIGDNGTGKSTLFQLITREVSPSRGAVTHQRGVRIGYLHQLSSLDPRRTVRETIATTAGDAASLEAELHALEARLLEPLDDTAMVETLDRHAHLLERFDSADAADPQDALAEVLGGLRFPEQRWDLPVGALSGGERKLVEVAQFLLDEPDLLLLDEPDNHLDIDARMWFEDWLVNRFSGAFCLVTHDRYMIDRVANEIAELEHGLVRMYPGNYTTYLEQKQARLEREADLRELAEREYKKLKESAEELTQWARQNPKFASRAENQRRKMAEERARLDAQPVPVLHKRRIQVDFATERGSTNVLDAAAAAKSFGERVVFEPFDLLIRHGERVGLVGPNGAGKTTFVRMVLGEETPTGGTLRLGPSIRAAYFSQEHETLDLDATPIETVRRFKAMTEQSALGFLAGLLFDHADATNRIGRLGGGERARLQVACLILSGANLLILDEPTNNLDIGSVESLEAALLAYPGAILTISHDRYYLDRICTRIIEMDAGIVRDYPGTWSWYAANRDLGAPLTCGMQDALVRAPEPAPKRKRARMR